MAPSYEPAMTSAARSGPVMPLGTQQIHKAQLGSSEGFSRPMPRPPSLLFDIEDLEAEGKASCGASEEDQHTGVKELKRWLLPGSTGELKLRQDVEQGLAQSMCQGTDLAANQALAAYLTRQGYFVHIRTALGGGEGCDCLRNLRNVFLTVCPPGAAQTTNRFLVDLSFKASFEIAKPTPRYASLLACLPEVYVAPEAAVAPLVNFLSQEMAVAFQATGVVLPPWRQTNSMLSKWLPRKSMDEHVRRSPSTAAMAISPGFTAHRRPILDLPVSTAATTAAQHPCGHWIVPPAQKAAAAAAALQQQQARGRLQPLAEEDPQTIAAVVPPMPVLGGPAATSTMNGPQKVKPIACEPRLKVVGGNFSAIGFP